jgi:hypothetical protein
LWLSPTDHKDNQDDWSPPIIHFQIAFYYNLGKHNILVDDAII